MKIKDATNEQLVSELLSRHKLFDAPTQRRYGGHVEACIGIGNDFTCELTLAREAKVALDNIAHPG